MFFSLLLLLFKIVLPHSDSMRPTVNSSCKHKSRNLLASTLYLPLEEVAMSAANYKYNHYNLLFSHTMIIIIISDEDMLHHKLLHHFDFKNCLSDFISLRGSGFRNTASYCFTIKFSGLAEGRFPID